MDSGLALRAHAPSRNDAVSAAYAFTDGRSPDARQPCGDVGVGGIERLADLVAEIEPAIEQDVGEREALAAQIFPAVAIWPFSHCRRLAAIIFRPGEASGATGNPLLEEFQRLAEAIAVGERLGRC